MGHQVNYYMTPHDLSMLEQNLRSSIDYAVIARRNQSKVPVQMTSLLAESNGQRLLFLYMVRPQDLNQVVSKYIDTQDYWTVQTDPSPVVEFGGCFFDGTILRRDRVYYVDRFLDTNHKWVTKSEDFRKWAKTLFSIIKKSLRPRKPGDKFTEYIGEGAAKWVASGGKLVE